MKYQIAPIEGSVHKNIDSELSAIWLAQNRIYLNDDLRGCSWGTDKHREQKFELGFSGDGFGSEMLTDFV